MSLQTLLRGLFDLTGVEFAFFTDLQGNCLSREGAPACDNGAVGDLSRRLLNILQAHEASLAEANEVFLCFSQKNLYARRSSDFLLGLICLPTTDLTSLRVGTRLALRQFESLPRAAASLPAAVVPPPENTTSTEAAEVLPVRTTPPLLPPPISPPIAPPPPAKAATPPPATPEKPKKKTRLGIWD